MKMLFQNERGMSLIEVLVAVLILGLALVPLMSTFASGSLFATRARHEVKALNLAQSKLEEIKNLPASSVASVTSPAAFPGNPGYSYQLSVAGGVYNLKTVTVSVYYQDGSTPKELVLTTEKLKR